MSTMAGFHKKVRSINCWCDKNTHTTVVYSRFEIYMHKYTCKMFIISIRFLFTPVHRGINDYITTVSNTRSNYKMYIPYGVMFWRPIGIFEIDHILSCLNGHTAPKIFQARSWLVWERDPVRDVVRSCTGVYRRGAINNGMSDFN